MMEQKKVDRAGAGAAETSHIAADPAPARRLGQTAARKQEAVLRVLRGEDIELMARGIDATAADVSGWRDVFLATGASGLRHRPRDVRDEEIDRLRDESGDPEDDMTKPDEIAAAIMGHLRAALDETEALREELEEIPAVEAAE